MPDLIDIHSHLYPRFYVEALKRRDTLPRIIGEEGAERFVIFAGEHGRPMGPDSWDLELKLEFMDTYGIGTTIASLGNPWLDPFTDAAESASLTDETNAYFSGLGAATDGRIVGMGVLPQHDVAAAAATVRQIAADADLYGVINACRICGLELDDPVLEPVWEALAETRLPLMLHPHYAVGSDSLQGFGHAFPISLGFPFETTVAVARAVFSGVLQRHPGLELVAVHGGGTIPFLAGRLDAGWRSDESVRGRLPVPPTDDLRKLFLDALVYHPGALKAVETLVGVERMAFGTDHPFSVADPDANLRAIDAAFDGAARDAVRFESARRFFGIPPAG
jgi:aminocarboxymuconate-semialdehyde decarboxylase